MKMEFAEQKVPISFNSLYQSSFHLLERDLSIHIKKKHLYLKLKRIIEIIGILAVTPIIVLLIGIICFMIFCFDGRQVFYLQERRGRYNKIFKVYKFRTMYPNHNNNALTLKDDHRITKIGKVLRKYKLDELPQLLNVFLGQMSLIGPRPVPDFFYKKYENNIPGYSLRHLVLPGITGLAQVEQGYTSTISEEQVKWEYDINYILNLSSKNDCRILFKTLSLLWSSKKSNI